MTACDRPQNSSTNIESAAKLFPELVAHIEQLHALEIKTAEDTLRIIKKNNNWYLDEPYSVPVYPDKINTVLLELMGQARGQEVRVDPEDYDKYGITDLENSQAPSSHQQVELALVFKDGSHEQTRCILGAFDFSNNREDMLMYGEETAARRYIRCAESGKIYLTPSSLSFLNTDLRQWENTTSPPMLNMRSVSVKAPDGFSWEASRKASYSTIQLKPPFENVTQSKELVDVFNHFLVLGYYEGIVPRSDQNLYLKNQPVWEIEAEDKVGQKFTVTVYDEALAKEQKTTKPEFSGGMMSMAPAERDGERFVVKFKVANAKNADAYEQALSVLNERLVYMLGSEVIPLMRITDQLRRKNK